MGNCGITIRRWATRPRVLVIVFKREQGKRRDTEEQLAKVDLEQLYPPFFIQDDRLLSLFAMFSSSVSKMFKAFNTKSYSGITKGRGDTCISSQKLFHLQVTAGRFRQLPEIGGYFYVLPVFLEVGCSAKLALVFQLWRICYRQFQLFFPLHFKPHDPIQIQVTEGDLCSGH